MAISSTAFEVSTRCAATTDTAAVVAPGSGCGYAAAFARRGWRPVAVDLAPRLRPPALARLKTYDLYAHRVEHHGSLRQTVKALRALGVSAVVAGSAAGIGLAERIAWQLDLPGADPAASLLRHDRGTQAAALARAGIAAPRGVRTMSLADALKWAEDHPLPGYLLAPAAVEVPVAPVTCEYELQISAAWTAMCRAAARHSGNAHLVLAERLPGCQYVVNSVTRLVDGHPDHVVTDVWAETRTAGGRLVRTDLLDRHQLLTRVLSMYVLRVLDTLGMVCGPVSSRVVYSEGRGPVLVSALAVPGTSPGDAALRAATGRDRFADAVDAVISPLPAQPVRIPTGHRIVRVHLHPGNSGRIDPWVARSLRRLPTVVAVGADPQPDPPAAARAGGEIVLSSSDPEAVEADYRTIRALERACLDRAAVDALHPSPRHRRDHLVRAWRRTSARPPAPPRRRGGDGEREEGAR